MDDIDAACKRLRAADKRGDHTYVRGCVNYIKKMDPNSQSDEVD